MRAISGAGVTVLMAVFGALGCSSSGGDTAAGPSHAADGGVAPADGSANAPDGAARDGDSPPAGNDASTDAAVTPVPEGGTWWKPGPGMTTWQWQLDGTLDTTVAAAMYDIDMFDNDASVIAGLEARGIKVVCYVDVGTYEPGRPDSSQFPAAVQGSDVQGWPGEKWLDITSPTVKTIMQARFALAAQKGCDGVEPDNVDGYENSPGFPFTAQDQITYNSWVAGAVHALGMSVALKNDTDQVATLEPLFDFELDEQCFQYQECATLAPFVNAGKAVFEVEYATMGDGSSASTICPQAAALHFDTLIKDLDLDAWRVSCE